MKTIIKEQDVEIVNFTEFEKEISAKHLAYLKSQISDGDLERLQRAIKDEDIVECAAITKSWNIDLENVTSGMFRKSVMFTKNSDDSYTLQQHNEWHDEYIFSRKHVLFILPDGIVTPIYFYHKDSLIGVKKKVL